MTTCPAAPFPQIALPEPTRHRRTVFHTKLDEYDDDRENAAFVLDAPDGSADRARPDFDDARWEEVSLPHTARIESLAAAGALT